MPDSGTQDSPLNSFTNAAGATGNATTNEDLPDWLKKLGMKGDAYAGGMLKPEIRYGYTFKPDDKLGYKGTLYFADGTSYKATQDRSKVGQTKFKYTDASGKPATYALTPEQFAYNQQYHEATKSPISDYAGGILNLVGTAVGGPVWGLMTSVADAGNKALHPDESSSSDFGKYGAAAGAVGSIYSGLGGPGSYGAAHPSGTPDKTGSNLRTASRLVGALSAATSKPGSSTSASGAKPSSVDTTTLPASTFSRHQSPFTGDYTKYGLGPEHSFFQSGAPSPVASVPVGVAPPTRLPMPVSQSPLSRADGGALKQYPLRPKGQPSQELRNFSNLPGMDDPRVRIAMGDRKTPTQFVSHGTGASGRADNIDAKLSENEYVIDAETVALLGDGSPEAGAKKLDTMRESIRRHKGQALAKGKISPDAHPGALHYLANGKAYAEGGKVTGALRALFKRKPPADPNAGLRRIKAQLDAALVRTPVPPPRRATQAELDQDVLDLRREVGPQGGDTRPLGRKVEYAEGGRIRPRQTLSQAMDEADTAFDKWKALPRADRRAATGDYEKRQRARVGDTTYDLDLPQRVARNNRGGK